MELWKGIVDESTTRGAYGSREMHANAEPHGSCWTQGDDGIVRSTHKRHLGIAIDECSGAGERSRCMR